jgi:NitT/TauT family transport system substrate-binding protein
MTPTGIRPMSKGLQEKTQFDRSRRRFVAEVSAFAGAGWLGMAVQAAAEPQPEVKRIRLIHAPSICLAPQLLAGELLRLEGFSEVQYVDLTVNKLSTEVAKGRADISMVAAPEVIPVLDAGEPVVLLAGIHAGCYELFGTERVRKIRDLKGSTVAISAAGSPEQTYISSIVAYLGMDPKKDVNWVIGNSSADAMRLFTEGKADAFLAFPPQPQELRQKAFGHLIVDTAKDRPWSQYFCCVVVANREFVRNNPIATKRALRAMLKGADICAQDPVRAARFLVEKKYEPRYDVALEVIKGLPYRRWRDADPEDTIRFHALRLYEAGIIKTTPGKLIAQGTDWRFLNELKKELKA